MNDSVRLLGIVLTGLGVVGFACLGVSEVEDLRRTPEHPSARTLAQLAAGDAPPWIRLTDGVPRCGRARRFGTSDVVPVVALDEAQAARPTRSLWVVLEDDELCALMRSPLLLRPLGNSTYAEHVLEDLPLNFGKVVGGDVFKSEHDALGKARTNAVVPFGLMLACIAGLAAQLHVRRKATNARPGAVGDVAAAPVAGVFEALVQGSAAHPAEAILPVAPWRLSAAAQSKAFRAAWVAPLLLALCSVALFGLSAWGTIGVVDDLRAWHGGVEVAAETKGRTTSKFVVSIVEVQLAWQMPGEHDVRTGSRSFMTLGMPDKDTGAVRALVDEPGLVTFEEAVDRVPFRVPLLLVGFGLALACLRGARSSRREADRVRRIAATGVEDVLRWPSFTETSVNGTTNGWVVNGLLRGKRVRCNIGPTPGPAGLIVADAEGGVLVARCADDALFTPIFFDGEPFAWAPGAWAHAQVVLQARGSPTRLVG
jgi:hypothetical protein